MWAVAQLAEHRVVIPAVAGSSPVRPPNHEHVAQWSKAAGCNPVIRWFKSSRALQYGKVAQTVERSVEARKAAGSMPALTTSKQYGGVTQRREWGSYKALVVGSIPTSPTKEHPI